MQQPHMRVSFTVLTYILIKLCIEIRFLVFTADVHSLTASPQKAFPLRVFPDFRFPHFHCHGDSPAHEAICASSPGKRPMSVPMTEIMPMHGVTYAGDILDRRGSLLFFRLHETVNVIIRSGYGCSAHRCFSSVRIIFRCSGDMTRSGRR